MGCSINGLKDQWAIGPMSQNNGLYETNNGKLGKSITVMSCQ